MRPHGSETQFTHTVPLPSNREVFLFGNLVAKLLHGRAPSFEERLQRET